MQITFSFSASLSWLQVGYELCCNQCSSNQSLCTKVLIRTLTWVHTLGLPQNTGDTLGISQPVFQLGFHLPDVNHKVYFLSGMCIRQYFQKTPVIVFQITLLPRQILDTTGAAQEYLYCLDKLSLSSWKKKKKKMRKKIKPTSH